MILSYCLDYVLSNKYLKVIMELLKPNILSEKVAGLFYEIKKSNKTSIFLLNILGSRNSMMTFKYLLYRA